MTSFKTDKQAQATLNKALVLAREAGVNSAQRKKVRRPPYPGSSEWAVMYQTAWLEGYDSIISQENICAE